MTTTHTAHPQPRIAIIGAGLGGLSLARMLHEKGLAATVFDKDRDTSERSVGGSLDMQEDSGLYAIQQLGLMDGFKQLARYEDQGMRLFDREGNLRFEANDGNRPEIDRGQLRDLLVNSVPTKWFRWNHELQETRRTADGSFDLVFRGGKTEIADIVVGADGVWSRVRPAVTDETPKYSGLTFFELEIKNVNQDHPGVASFITKGLHMALAEGKLISTQRNAAGHARLYAALFVPEDGQTKNGHPTVRPRTRSELTAEFAGWGQALVNLFHSAEAWVRPWPIYVMPVDHTWPHRHGITLLGDAAHVMPPAGDGANLAMRDGVDLACALADTGYSDQAIAKFESAMFDRANVSARMASAALLEGSSEDRLALIQHAMSPAHQ